ncbi:MAG: rod shape-determining protein MreC [Bacteroidales bacterium]|nr:rod shape-determining protein MreC [Bacteroidales bacterium]
MKELLRFLIKYYYALLFILLESIGIVILVRNNTYQRTRFVNLAHTISGNFSKKIAVIKDYLTLHEENRQLIEENNRLYNLVKSSVSISYTDLQSEKESFQRLEYIYIPARVINNSTNKQFNYIILDKGREDGIEQDMAVVCSDGIVGVIKEVSEHFSSAISFLNRNLQISAKIKKSGHFGPLQWTGTGHQKARLKDIPHNISIELEDSIVTSGYSAIFPENYMIGRISDFSLKGGNYYEITVHLSTDFKNLRNVQVIKNLYREEQMDLEERTRND